MANTYTQIHYHAVFAVQNKDTFLTECVGDLCVPVFTERCNPADCYNNPLGMKHSVKKPIIQSACIPLGMKRSVKKLIIQSGYIPSGMQGIGVPINGYRAMQS